MIGLFYLLIGFFSGFFLLSLLLPSTGGLVKLAASFLTGYFLLGWLTFLLTLLFSFSADPLGWGITGTLVTVGIIAGFCWRMIRKKFGKFSLREMKSFKKIKVSEWVFLVWILIFSFWLMAKSFGYQDNHFLVASNVFTDFNTHLSLVRSFSWGENFPPQMPFLAGEPIKYHFLTDFSFAVFESLGWPMNRAINFPSGLAFASLLILIYSLAKKVFADSRVGFLSVIFFLFNGSFTFFKFIGKYGLSGAGFKQIWRLGEYLSAGPFDKGVISIFWNLNTFLNQRHFIFAAGLFLLLVIVLLESGKTGKTKLIFGAGILAGLIPLWHSLVFLSALTVGLFLVKPKKFGYFFLPALSLALPQIIFLSGKNAGSPFLKLGFMVAQNPTWLNWFRYWLLNLGLGFLTIIAGFWLANKKQKNFYLPFMALFVLGNLVQFSSDMVNNHKLFNLWLLASNFYSAFLVVSLLKRKWFGKLLAATIVFFLTFSGVIDLMVIKNDFIHRIPDAPADQLTAWIKNNTLPEEVFLTDASLYNPVNLAGRKAYFSQPHTLWQFGYRTEPRIIFMRQINDDQEKNTLSARLKEARIDYWLAPKPIVLPLESKYENEKYAVYEVD